MSKSPPMNCRYIITAILFFAIECIACDKDFNLKNSNDSICEWIVFNDRTEALSIIKIDSISSLELLEFDDNVYYDNLIYYTLVKNLAGEISNKGVIHYQSISSDCGERIPLELKNGIQYYVFIAKVQEYPDVYVPVSVDTLKMKNLDGRYYRIMKELKYNGNSNLLLNINLSKIRCISK